MIEEMATSQLIAAVCSVKVIHWLTWWISLFQVVF